MPLWSYLLAHMSTSFPGRWLWCPALNSEDAIGSGQNTKESTVRLPDQTSLCRQYRSTGQPERNCQNVCTPRLPTPDFAIRRTYGNAGSGSTKVERGVSCCRAPLQFMRGPHACKRQAHIRHDPLPRRGKARNHGQTMSFPIANAMSASSSNSPPVIKSFVNLSFGGRPVTASHA